jgi:DNA-directed RNA polymerase subunit RPC12/RpoP
MECFSNSMSEFKFVCPVCGQHIKCESWRSNTMMECPTCFQRIIVPQSPATDDVQLIITGQKAGRRPVPTAMTNLGTTTPPVKKSPMAAIAFVVLLCAAVAAVFVFRGKIFRSTNIQSTTASQTNPAPVQKNGTPARPVVVAPPANDTNWMLTLDEATIPGSTAAGRVHGQDFLCGRAFLQNGTLVLRAGTSGPPDFGLAINFSGAPANALAGKTINVTTDADKAARVALRWRESDQPRSETFTNNYAMRLEFGMPANNHLPGKIYFCAPDKMKSYILGTFNAEIRKPKPSR